MEYRCDVCSETFTSSWTLARHRKSEHRDLPLEEEQAGISVEGVVSLDEFTAEELSVLPKEVLAVYCTEGSSGSQEILDVSCLFIFAKPICVCVPLFRALGHNYYKLECKLIS